MFALSVLTMLSGCGALDSKSTPPSTVDLEATAAAVIPDLSPVDARRCYDPGVPDGVDALEIIAEHRVALSDCRQRHGRVVAQYGEVKSLFFPPPEARE